MKLSRFLSSISSNSRNHFEQILSRKTSGLYRFSSQASHGNGNGIPGATPQVFASYAVFKGKASLSITPCHPTFTRLNSGNLVINRRGSVMFTFCPAIGERKYDWERKQLFALSPTEVGTLISLGPKDSCEFFHDPAMLSSNAGQVRKNLSIKSQSEGNGYFISLSVVNNILKTKENFYVPFTIGEFSVMKTACSFALPHILGWDRLSKLTNLEEDVVVPSKVVDRQALSLEWEK